MSPAVWWRRYSPRPRASTRVFCLPHAGGSASIYRGWALASPPDVEIVSIQYPGHEDLLAAGLAASMTELVDGIADQLRPLLDLPSVLFGHSMGAAVGYEVARRLEARRAGAPRLLVVSGRPAPHRSRAGAVHLGTDDDLAADLKRLSGTSADVLSHPGLRRIMLPIIRHDYRLIETYRPLPGAPLRAATTVLYATDDPEVTRAEAEDWRTATTGSCEVLAFAGDHFYFGLDGEPALTAVIDRTRTASSAAASWERGEPTRAD